MKKLIIMITLAILIAGCKTVFMTTQKEIKLKIIETTDVHGAIFPKDLINQKISEGSLAQVYTYVTEQREDKSQEVILIDNGDILQGTPLVYYYNFEVPDSIHLLSKVMNFMAYDVATIGKSLRRDLNLIILTHSELDDKKGCYKIKTIGKMLDNSVTIDGLFPIALYTYTEHDPKEKATTFNFLTRKMNDLQGNEIPAKSPPGMFKDALIPNDLGLVLKMADEYYG